MSNVVKHAFGTSERINTALEAGAINGRDVVYLDEDTNPKIGWIKKDGTPVVIDVDGKIETATAGVEKRKFEITGTPNGTLISYGEREIRVMCPADATYTKQSVGVGGDPNTYYITFKTYAPNDSVAGYIEHLNGEADEEILTSFNVDEYGRRYQPTWLGVAKYDEASDSWIYYGKSSNQNKYIGWDYRIDWYDENGVMVASDGVRINLSNEDCHTFVEPYYINTAISSANAYTDAQIANMANSFMVVEF